MALNLCIDSISNIVVNMSLTLDNYIVNASMGNSYTYNLPPITCDGKIYNISRVDATNSLVNIVGPIYANSGTISTFELRNYATISLISLGTSWYLVYNEINSQFVNSNIFTSFYYSNNSNPYITLTSNTTFLIFPFLGTASGNTISRIVFTMANTNTTALSFSFYNSSGATIFTVNIPVVPSLLVYIYSLTAAEKSLLPINMDYIESTLVSGTVNISSILFYS